MKTKWVVLEIPRDAVQEHLSVTLNELESDNYSTIDHIKTIVHPDHAYVYVAIRVVFL